MQEKLEVGRTYEFHVKQFKEVPMKWKIMHMLCYVPIGFSGLSAFMAFNSIRVYFNGNCLLYCNVTMVYGKNTSYSQISEVLSYWGRESVCEYIECITSFSFILAIVWFCIFSLCGRGGSSLKWLPQGWRIIIPAFIFNTIYLILSFTATITLTIGYDSFFNSLSTVLNNKSGANCENLPEYISNFPRNVNPTSFYFDLGMCDHIFLSKVSVWVNCSSWLIAALIAMMRIICAADFKHVTVTIYIQELEEPKHKIHKLETVNEEGESEDESDTVYLSQQTILRNSETQTDLTMADYRKRRT